MIDNRCFHREEENTAEMKRSDTLPVVGSPMEESIPGVGRGGGNPIFSYVRRFGTLFWVQNSNKMNILRV